MQRAPLREEPGRDRKRLTRAALGSLVSVSVALACQKAVGSSERAEPAPAPARAVSKRPAPEADAELITREQPCMGTRCTFMVFHHDAALVQRALSAASVEIERLDRLMTSWLETSDVSRINAAAGNGQSVAVSPETFAVLSEAKRIARLSEGAFDVTVGAFKGLWRFDEDQDGSLPDAARVRERRELVRDADLTLDEARRTARLARARQRITLGGIAKGFVVDRAVGVLRAAGLDDFVVQAGGDLFASGRRGGRPWRVGIQDPRASAEAPRSTASSFAMLELSDGAFNTSGDYERFVIRDGRRYHHILDPRTGFPVEHTRSVTLLAPTSFEADALDTAVFVMGWQRGLQLVERLPGIEAVIVDAQNAVHVSSGLETRLSVVRPPTGGI